MKRIIISLLLFTNTYSLLAQSPGTVTGLFPQGNTNTPVTFSIQQPFEITLISYQNGGSVITYDTAFEGSPIVIPSVILNSNSLVNSTYLAVVSANSQTSSTITVYRIPLAGGAIVEAGTNEVEVGIFALESF